MHKVKFPIKKTDTKYNNKNFCNISIRQSMFSGHIEAISCQSTPHRIQFLPRWTLVAWSSLVFALRWNKPPVELAFELSVLCNTAYTSDRWYRKSSGFGNAAKFPNGRKFIVAPIPILPNDTLQRQCSGPFLHSTFKKAIDHWENLKPCNIFNFSWQYQIG